ncbi:MgtC/SapB family protein [Rhizobium sp. Root1220]|uniref:MgtC/SapB family protein n=1 Tax=Rhizobium sp. Root1220 TaxID=1736432 RepID=UPI0006FCBE91|nr:MgtC/SapB family protein [Rhizobium sp. Root1220]KQV66257.1 methyltransferase [Rhizobium sp. Root1220]
MWEFASDWSGALLIAPRLLAAAFLGALVGIERQWRQRYTGLTTHALVSLGAAIYTSLPALLHDIPDVRMGGQVVTGIGFLGAGLIMRDGTNVRGLSTAATVWATGAIGVLAGYAMLIEAIEATILIIAINVGLPRLGIYISSLAPAHDAIERFYVIELKCAAHDEATVRTQLLQALSPSKLRLHSMESHAVDDTGSAEVKAVVFSTREEDKLIEQLIGQLSLAPHIFSSSWTSTAPPE